MTILPQFTDFFPFICWCLYVHAKPLQSCSTFCQLPVFLSFLSQTREEGIIIQGF